MMKKASYLFIVFVLFSIFAEAATITKVKGNRALISLEGLSANKGDEFYGVDSSGKRKAIIRVTSVKKGQAVARILKGKAEVGQKLTAYKKSSTPSTDEAALPEVPKSSLSNFGILASYLINNMSAKFTLNSVEHKTDMTGNGFGALGYYDFKMGEATQIRATAGVEQFQVSQSAATPICDKGSTTTCNAIITYLSTYGLLKYNFMNGYTKAWFGAGGGYLFALSKASTVLDSSQISANYVVTISGGIDINMKRHQYIPIVLEYSFFPPSNTVSANYIALRVGWGWR